MRLQDLLEADVPDDEVEPISHDVSTFSLELLGLQDLLGHILTLPGCHRATLGSVLLEVLSYVVVIKTLANLLETRKDFRHHVDLDLLPALHRIQPNFEIELIPEVVELLFLELFHHDRFRGLSLRFADELVEELIDVLLLR